jgi:hypothetical protein
MTKPEIDVEKLISYKSFRGDCAGAHHTVMESEDVRALANQFQSALKAKDEEIARLGALVPKITNEMKAAHIGEYSFKHKTSCNGGDLEGCDGDRCHICDGSGWIEDDLIVPWDTCKQIFKGMHATFVRPTTEPHSGEDGEKANG